MERVQHIDPEKDTSVAGLVRAMEKVGVLGAGRLGRAAAITSRMFNDPECYTFLSLSGPMVPGGLRRVVTYLVRNGYVDAIVTSGANIVHDVVEAYGGAHYRTDNPTDDKVLRSKHLGRIGDILIREKDFAVFEKGVYDFLDQLDPQKTASMAPSEFLRDYGLTLTDEESILRQAALRGVPIFSPGIMDSMLGFHIYAYSTTKKFTLDFVKDLRILGEIVHKTKKTGAIMLGGGLSKHFTMGCTILRGGLDLAVQITLDRPEGGSLSGAPLVEGISWQKVQTDANCETVIGDATIVFPLLVIAALSGPETGT